MIRYLFSRMMAALFALSLGLSLAVAQTPSAIDYDAWTRLAERAETVIGAARASTPAFEDLRAQLVEARTQFQDAQSTNADRIRTLQEQIAALGPAPEGDATEPPEIAARRAELTQQLATAQAPVLRADEAYRRADGLIREIDAIIRDRQTEEVLELTESPLLPTSWSDTVTALSSTATAIYTETATDLNNPIRQVELQRDLLQTVLYLVLALAVVLRGRRWMERLTLWLTSASGLSRGRAVAGFVVSLGQIVVPYLGIVAMVEAVQATGLFGLRGAFVLDLVPPFALIVFSSRWLGGRVFGGAAPLMTLGPIQRREGLLYAAILGVVLGLYDAANALMAFESYPPGAVSVIRSVLVVTAAVMLLRLSMMLRSLADRRLRQDESEGEPEDTFDRAATFRDRLLGLLARIGLAISVLAPAAAAFGYVRLGTAMVFPAIESLALIALLAVLHRMTREVYAALRGLDLATARESLFPVLFDMVFLVLSIPVFALIWGARVSDLTEVWTRFLAGVSIGGAQISPAAFLTFAVVFGALYTVTRLGQSALRTTVLPRTRIDPGGQTALISGVGYLGIFLSAVIAITTAGIDLSNLALVAGALSVGIGFGLQTIVSNFVSGIILLIERPVAQGDWIEVNGTMGIVKDISVRSTTIETFDKTNVILPNADLISGAVTNYTRGTNRAGRIILTVGVAYGTDTRKVEQILKEIAEAHPMVSLNPGPMIVFQGFGADSLDFEMRCILRDISFGLGTRTELNHAIAERFAAEGIEIPFAQRDIWLRNPEALAAGRPQASAPAPVTPDPDPNPETPR